jgi:hypothetical protein
MRKMDGSGEQATGNAMNASQAAAVITPVIIPAAPSTSAAGVVSGP